VRSLGNINVRVLALPIPVLPFHGQFAFTVVKVAALAVETALIVIVCMNIKDPRARSLRSLFWTRQDVRTRLAAVGAGVAGAIGRGVQLGELERARGAASVAAIEPVPKVRPIAVAMLAVVKFSILLT